jgi:DNA-binding transcriptional LysR family regulator
MLHPRKFDLSDLETFVHVVDTGSFTRAATALAVPTSTVSRRVARLEDAVGVELLVRSGRRFHVSVEGLALHARCAPALREIADAERTFEDARAEPTGLLRITTTSDLGSTPFFAAMLTEFRARWPGIRLDLELSARRVDLVEEGFDVAIRAHGPPLPDSSSLMVRRLLGGVARMFAAPAYLERCGRPASPAALRGHACLSLRIPALIDGWPLARGKSARVERVPIDPAIVANDFGVLTRAAIAGAGIALLPTFMVDAHVTAGELGPVLPAWHADAGQFSLVWPVRRHPAPRVRALIDFAVEHFARCEHARVRSVTAATQT